MKCEDGPNPKLVVKTLVQDHNCYRIFNNPKWSVSSFAKLYKQNPWKAWLQGQDLKKDAKEELKVNVGYPRVSGKDDGFGWEFKHFYHWVWWVRGVCRGVFEK